MTPASQRHKVLSMHCNLFMKTFRKRREVLLEKRFPDACSIIGGAQKVQYSKRFAYITMPGLENPVRVSRKKLHPSPNHWTAFNMAEAAKKQRDGRK